MPDSQIRLHDYPYSSAAYRARIGLALKGVDYVRVGTDLRSGAQRSPEYLAVNPQGLVPALEIDGHVLTQSLAILDYLDARFPQAPFLPRDAAARARVLSMALTIACDIQPLNNVRVLNYLAGEMRQDKVANKAWYAHWIALGFESLERHARDGGSYLSGETPGLADICLVPQMQNARRMKVPLEAFPTLVRIDADLTALPAFAAAHPDRAVS